MESGFFDREPVWPTERSFAARHHASTHINASESSGPSHCVSTCDAGPIVSLASRTALEHSAARRAINSTYPSVRPAIRHTYNLSAKARSNSYSEERKVYTRSAEGTVVDGNRQRSLWRAVADLVPVPGEERWAVAVCRICADRVDGIDAAALTLRAGARAQDMLGASDDWAAQLDDAQYTLGEGPGMHAFTTGAPVLVADLSVDETRWPGFSMQPCLPASLLCSRFPYYSASIVAPCYIKSPVPQ